jgi:hypothetical protein
MICLIRDSPRRHNVSAEFSDFVLDTARLLPRFLIRCIVREGNVRDFKEAHILFAWQQAEAGFATWCKCSQDVNHSLRIKERRERWLAPASSKALLITYQP